MESKSEITKLCECGCGKPAPLAAQSVTRLGYIKGKPLRFINGHSFRMLSDAQRATAISKRSVTQRRPVEDRFWQKVSKNGPIVKPELGPCWIWTGARDPNGYGRFRDADGHSALAHRISLELSGVTVPDNLYACHKCDNPPCVNPSHLVMGTELDNVSDMDAKGRRRTKPTMGVANHFTKYSDEVIKQMRLLHSQGWTIQAIANNFGAGRNHVSAIVHYKRRKEEAHVH